MVVVVGGHSRNVGKTSVAAALIAATRHAGWTAVKITQYGHGRCATEGEECECAASDPAHPFAIDEETAPSHTDSGRFLAAGAKRAFWVRTRIGDLGHAMPALRRIVAESAHTIVESNSVMNFLVPDLYIAVLDFGAEDMKESARLFLPRADALAVTGGSRPEGGWLGIPARWLAAKPVFAAPPPGYANVDLARLVEAQLGSSSTH